MKTGDVVILRTKIVEEKDRSGGAQWTISSKDDELTLIEGKADIGGCVLARDRGGKVRCINPDLFEVLYTAEEAVAKRLMESEPVTFRPVSPEEAAARFNRALVGSMASAVAKDIDKAIMDSMLPAAGKEGTERLAKVSGWRWVNVSESQGKNEK